MAIAKKALVWGLFAAGGTLTAFLFPALISLFLVVSMGTLPPALSFENVHGFVQSWSGKLLLFVILFLALWHAAHRMRVILHDLGVRADGIIGGGLYLLATLACLATAVLLYQI